MLMITAVSAVGAEGPHVAIIHSQEMEIYRQTAESFKVSLKQAHPTIEFVRLDSEGADNTPLALVFALGAKALRLSLSKLVDRELVATMITSAKVLQDASNATAVVLKTSPLRQLELHQRFLPKVRRVGILYNPQLNQQWIDAAQAAAIKLDLEIIAVPVRFPKDLPAALKSLSRRADTLLGIPDKTVYSGKTAEAVLLFSFRQRIPFIGLSGAWVKAGALYALDWDYSDLGRQCAAIALKILNGEKAGMIEPQLADKRLYVINLRTVEHMKLNVSQELIDGASKIYQ